MGEDLAKKKKKKEGPAEARKRRKAIITSHRAAGGVSSTPAAAISAGTACEDATTTTTTTEPSSMMEAAMAVALAEASTPLMEAALLAAATAAVECSTTTSTKNSSSTRSDAAEVVAASEAAEDTISSENHPADGAEECRGVAMEDAVVDACSKTDVVELAEASETAAGEEPLETIIEMPLSKDSMEEAKSDARPPKPDDSIEATADNDESDADEQYSDAEKSTIETVVTKKRNPNGSKNKTQICYEPSVPMSKDQLAAWRREARKVRNRESAAASRQRTRSRIAELEDEVTDWKEKYNTAMGRLQELQQQQQQTQSRVDGVKNSNADTGTLA